MELHVANLRHFAQALDRTVLVSGGRGHNRFIDVNGNSARIRIEMQILAILQRGQCISVSKLIEEIYGDDPEGGPLTADKCIHVAIHRMRRRGIPIKRELKRGYYMEAA